MIGFNATGQLIIQTLGRYGIYATSSSSGILSVNQWSHVSMTYSTTNGIRLYVSGQLMNNYTAFTDYAASGKMNMIIIGTSLWPNTCPIYQTNNIALSQFRGKIDELKIFSRELSANEVAQLAQTTNIWYF